MISNDKWLDACCCSIDFDLENRRTIYDFTAKAGAKFSGSFNIYNEKTKKVETIYITKVIYNNPVTIVFWSDGTKTTSKALKGDKYSEENGLIYCIIKRLDKSLSLRTLFDEWIPKQQTILDGPKYITLKDVRANSKG
jgi:hypothetical protein